MKKIVFVLLLIGMFYLGTVWDELNNNKTEIAIEKENKQIDKNIVKEVKEKEFEELGRKTMLYRLDEDQLIENGLKEDIEGKYKIYLQKNDGQTYQLLDGEREIIKSDQEYFLVLNSYYNLEKDESVRLEITTRMGLKLKLVKI
jgi:hypothetical protein